MAITIDLDTAIGMLRFLVGDDIDETGNATPTQGVLPNGANLTDLQLQALIDREGATLDNLDGAVAATFELLHARFAQVTNLAEGGRSEQLGAIADKYADLAKQWRNGAGGTREGAFSVGVTRGGDTSGAEYTED